MDFNNNTYNKNNLENRINIEIDKHSNEITVSENIYDNGESRTVDFIYRAEVSNLFMEKSPSTGKYFVKGKAIVSKLGNDGKKVIWQISTETTPNSEKLFIVNERILNNPEKPGGYRAALVLAEWNKNVSAQQYWDELFSPIETEIMQAYQEKMNEINGRK